jgi:hypothetical protein
MDVLDLKVNSAEVTPEKFVLDQPAGSHVTRLK